mmetsp:Transcript_31333/g.31819  ORF Transcript_31333/g.31819 Transcript_31333/m.31819 type:complete len:422 (+) Transcript_31333:789-2054(+)
MILPGTKRSKSCFDRDIDPLFCAWGIDVYELFVNTKSDIGPNPYTVDEAARKEYISLSRDEKERLGAEYRLFSKLQELVQHCDRTVSRNNEKLKRELSRQSQKRGGNDYVVDVSEEKVEDFARAEIKLEYMKDDLEKALKTLTEVQAKEEIILEQQRREQKEKDEEKTKHQANDESNKEQDKDGVVDVKKDDEQTGNPTENESKEEDEKIVLDYEGTDSIKKGRDATNNDEDPSKAHDTLSSDANLEELAMLTLKKQKLLCQIANLVSQLGSLEESIDIHHLKLTFVRSDTTTDKTVCHISGNFMSARDADERIAAHFAGKQYVGWKLVRDKFQEIVQKYGRYGPRPPQPTNEGRGGAGGAPLMSYQQMQQGGGGGGPRRSSYNSGGNNRSGGRVDDRRGSSRGDGRYDRGGGGGGGGGYG